MNSITRSLVSQAVSNQKLVVTAFTTLPTELQLEILDYIPRRVVFQPKELAFLKHLYIYTFYYHRGDDSWLTDQENFLDFMEYTEGRNDDYDFDDDESCLDTFFERIPDDLRKSRLFMNTLIIKTPKAQEYIIEPMTDQDCYSIAFTTKQFDYYRKITLDSLYEEHYSFDYVSDELKKDRKFMLAAVQKINGALEYAPDELQNDREIVLTAVKRDGYFLYDVSYELQNDFEIVLAAVQQNGYALGSAYCKLSNNREIVLAAVKQLGGALKYASKELKNDREIVLAAVQQNGYALKYASAELQKDSEIVLTAY